MRVVVEAHQIRRPSRFLLVLGEGAGDTPREATP
jgi:hypothetical protein